MRTSLSILILLAFLLSACGTEEETAPEYFFERPALEKELFTGTIDGQEVSAELSTRGELLTGELTFKEVDVCFFAVGSFDGAVDIDVIGYRIVNSKTGREAFEF